jgi:hypothetical protein
MTFTCLTATLERIGRQSEPARTYHERQDTRRKRAGVLEPGLEVRDPRRSASDRPAAVRRPRRSRRASWRCPGLASHRPRPRRPDEGGGAVRVAVIGAGNIGGTIGPAFAHAGNDVVFGSRSPGNDRVAQDTGARVSDVATALKRRRGGGAGPAGSGCRRPARSLCRLLAGRLVLDCANRVGGPGPANSHEAITSKVQQVRYARVFNSLGVEDLADPRFGDDRSTCSSPHRRATGRRSSSSSTRRAAARLSRRRPARSG